jgi:hypothetical protein
MAIATRPMINFGQQHFGVLHNTFSLLSRRTVGKKPSCSIWNNADTGLATR